MIKLLLVTTDNREHRGCYDMPEPWLSAPVLSLVNGFGRFPNEIEVHIASCAKQSMSAPEKLADNVYFHQPIVPKIGWGRSLFLGCAYAVRQLARRLGADIVHGQGTERDSAMAAACSGKPCVITIHGHMARIAGFTQAKFGSYYWMASRLERWVVRHSDAVVALNTFTKEGVAKGAIRTWIIPNAVEKEFFTDQPHQTSNSHGICVANISPWKNQVGLIDSCRPLLESGLCGISFAGSLPIGTPYAETFESRLRDLPGIRHLGFLSSDAIRAEIAKSGFLILPSFEENCPMAILEAMAAGVPVIASRIGGIPDLIRDDETGLMFDPNDPADVRRQVERISTDPQLRSRLGANGQAEALRRFHPEVVAKAHINVYQDVIAISRKR
jgi:glycosyltransferase involved in cell wall biosynthesis